MLISLKFKLYLSSRGRLRYKAFSSKRTNRIEKASKACGGYLNKLLEVKAVFRGGILPETNQRERLIIFFISNCSRKTMRSEQGIIEWLLSIHVFCHVRK